MSAADILLATAVVEALIVGVWVLRQMHQINRELTP